MLQIKNISKQYKTGELVQIALNDVSLNFRDNEFVSILGPSGSGKTTLLNIVGGLDSYDSGDLVINNISTKHYNSHDWDSYRNHTIGFVFQSYNLIPHQTVLANVELALTISGISKKERRKRALETLEKVGLREQAHKKPNQMSGGQMQRVAIARALVNDPEILLADEPTGALDTETSVQVMELLKEVAKDRLVIMVTHNPELAENYSTRIVKLRDGKIIDDTNPLNIEDKNKEKPKYKNMGKASMSFFTALSLSFNNLLTKKGRTILTSFAGSIGIIGIALILSLSTGFQNYIDKIQEDTLSSYPLTVTSETADATSMLLSMVSEKSDAKGENVKEAQNIATMFSKVGTNDLKSLKVHLEENEEELEDMVTLTRYQYSVTPLIYTKDIKGEITQLNPSTILSSFTGGMQQMASMSGMAVMSVFTEMVDNDKMIEEQYKVLKGKFPEKANEVMLILPAENEISDLLLYSLGLREGKELEDMLSKIMKGETVENKNKPLEFTYDELMSIPLKVVDPTDTYKYNKKYEIYEDMTGNKKFMQEVYDEAYTLDIVGIVCPKSKDATSMTMGIAYTKDLTEYVINKASESEIVKKQLENENINVFSNKAFDDETKEMGLDFEDMISVDEKMLSEAFGTKIDEKDISNMTEGYMTEISAAITTDTSKAKEDYLTTLSTLTKNILIEYINKNQVMGMATIKLSDIDKLVDEGLSTETSTKFLQELENNYVIPKENLKKDIYSPVIKGFLTSYITMTSQDKENPSAMLVEKAVEPMIEAFIKQEQILTVADEISKKMVEANMQKTILTKVGELTGELMTTMSSAFNVDQSKIAGAFRFNLTEEELMRIFETMTATGVESSETNLVALGYQDLEKPTTISFYFKDFDSKEKFIDFLEEYNEDMKKDNEDKVIKYTDITGILMSSVKVIIDSVSYVLIAFVSISLVVSSIMIGIITYISVLERTKEIGVLRAIGASKKNISSIFNAETFIVGFFAGILGIVVSWLLLFPINSIIHTLTGNPDITAVLPIEGAVILVVLSVILTLIGGIIPSRHAAKKDPVLALRSE